MYNKTLPFILTLLLVLGFGVNQAAAGGSASYYIDSIFDDVNTDNYLNTVPTFQRNSTYNLTIQGHGTDGDDFLIFSGESADDTTKLGLYIDYDNDIPDNNGFWWSFQPGDLVAIGTSGDVGGPNDANYQITDSFTVPGDAELGQVAAFAFLTESDWIPDPLFEHFPAKAVIFGDAKEYIDVNITDDQPVVPEPTTLALLSFGLAGAGLHRRKRK